METHLHVSGSPESFYDQFCARFINDVVEKNERVTAQKVFLKNAIHPNTGSVLIIGAGSGETAFFLAKTTEAKILAVDISSEALKIASKLFSHPRVEYRHVDVTREQIEGAFDVIFLPDVYEHIPQAFRPELHQAIDRLLSPSGQIVITVPSPAKQKAVYEEGSQQIVDEIITLDILREFASAIHGDLDYFNVVSIWHSGDYIHAVIRRRSADLKPLAQTDRVPLRTHIYRSFARKLVDFGLNRSGLRTLSRAIQRKRIKSRL